MADREKVIKGLEYCIGHHLCLGCGYYDPNNARCQKDLMRDALELLKEQEPIRPILARIGNYDAINDYTCPVCGTDLYHLQKYCDECGRAVKRNA